MLAGSTTLARVLLTRLGIPKLWGEDVDRGWVLARSLVSPTTLALAPGSYGYGLDRVPRSGGAVLAANHLAAIDHPLIGTFCPRNIHYMAKVELMEMPFVGEILSWIGTFPVRRGEGDRQALRRARELVREGHVVGVHVEGTRQRLGYPGPVKIGGMMIAMQEGVPVYPCAVETFRWSLDNPRACSVVWGEPIDLGGLKRNREGYEEAMHIVGDEIVRLWRLACEAVARGFPPVLSDGARRYRSYIPWVVRGRKEPVPG